MLKYFFLLIFSQNCFAQVQSLAEYNRTLAAKIATKKPLSTKEFKTLRIRLGTEVDSADEVAYKGRELLRLLEYSSLITYFSKNKDEEKVVQEMWNRYLALPNTTNTTIEISYLTDVFKGDQRLKPLEEFQIGEYVVSKYGTKAEKKIFFYPILREKCQFMMYRRKTAELKECWQNEKEFIQFDNRIKFTIYREKLSYYYSSHQFRNELVATFDEILKDESVKPLWQLTEMIQLANRIRENDLKGVADKLDALRRLETDTSFIDKIITSYYLRQNNLEKSLDTFKGIIDNDKSLAVTRSYNNLAAALYYAKKELRKSLFYINKLLESEDIIFEKVQHYFKKQMLGIQLKTGPTSAEVRLELEKYEKELATYEINDPLINAVITTSRLFADDKNINMPALKKSIADLKIYFYPDSYLILMAEHSYTFLEEYLENQAQEKKAAAIKKPAKPPKAVPPAVPPEVKK